MKKIYVIWVAPLNSEGTDYRTGISVKGNTYRCSPYTYGWFENFEKAEQVVLDYDIWEFYFTHACIEEVPEGGKIGTVKQWYRVVYDYSKVKETDTVAESFRNSSYVVEKCDPPPYAERCVGFSMGG